MFEAVVFTARNDMPMSVVNHLPRGIAVVHFKIPTVASGGGANGRGLFFNGQRQSDKVIVRGDGDVLTMNFGNDQKMPGVDRINIQKGHNFFIFVNKIDRDLFGDNFTEETIHIFYEL